MGRYSDSDDDKKKRKKKKKRRSRSISLESSDSRHSHKLKKSKKHKKQRSKSRSPDNHRRRSRSRSPKYTRRRSRSKERSTTRYSRSRSRSPGYSRVSSRRINDRRSRSTSRDYRGRSRSRDRYRRSRSRSLERYKSKLKRRSRSLDRLKSSSRYSSGNSSPARKLADEDPVSKIPGFSDMPPAEQAKIRMQLALKAAAAADEKIKEQIHGNRLPVSNAIEDQLKFSNAVQDIESSSFEASTFKSARSDKPNIDDRKMDFFNFGTAAEFKPDMIPKKKLVIDETSNLAHPNLFVEPEEKMDRWIQRLAALRKKKLEGEAIQ